MDETQDQIIDQPSKISFRDLCLYLKLGDGAWDDLDWMANVAPGTIWKMFIGHPVSEVVAEKVLLALSEQDDETTWTLDTVEVAFLTAPKCGFAHAFRQGPITYQTLVALAATVGIARLVVHCMITGRPVEREDAEKVLHLLSVHTDRVWSFETVDVPLLAPPQVEEQLASIAFLPARELGKKYTRRIQTRKKSSKKLSSENKGEQHARTAKRGRIPYDTNPQ